MSCPSCGRLEEEPTNSIHELEKVLLMRQCEVDELSSTNAKQRDELQELQNTVISNQARIAELENANSCLGGFVQKFSSALQMDESCDPLASDNEKSHISVLYERLAELIRSEKESENLKRALEISEQTVASLRKDLDDAKKLEASHGEMKIQTQTLHREEMQRLGEGRAALGGSSIDLMRDAEKNGEYQQNGVNVQGPDNQAPSHFPIGELPAGNSLNERSFRDPSRRWRRPTIVHPTRYTVPKIFSASLPPQALDLFDWGYDVMCASKQVPSILQSIGKEIVERWRLFKSTEAKQRWGSFCALVESNYLQNPYHNSVHAADVAQGVCSLVMASRELFTNMTVLEKLALVFATLTHDIRHPARGADFLRKKFDELYFHHNGISVLEQMHISTAFDLLAVPSVDFTEKCMSDAEVLEFHRMVSTLVLHTDMSRHFEDFARWKARAAARDFCFTKPEDRLEVLTLLLHAADIGAAAKGVGVAGKWLGVLDEMYAQGDDEKQLSLPVTPYCVRGSSLAKSQLCFLRVFVIPLFYVVRHIISEMEAPIIALKELYAHYQREEGGDTEPFPSSPFKEASSDSAGSEAVDIDSLIKEKNPSEAQKKASNMLTKGRKRSHKVNAFGSASIATPKVRFRVDKERLERAHGYTPQRPRASYDAHSSLTDHHETVKENMFRTSEGVGAGEHQVPGLLEQLVSVVGFIHNQVWGVRRLEARLREIRSRYVLPHPKGPIQIPAKSRDSPPPALVNEALYADFEQAAHHLVSALRRVHH
ncbi:unnamed protein product [Phytomonas sp. EM1]|nr:unnamed protein product [Phytomonas sp. EM1]|eukprot:CCW59752.1 unnamed protein product [Phytomonas sp. isolate EM1]